MAGTVAQDPASSVTSLGMSEPTWILISLAMFVFGAWGLCRLSLAYGARRLSRHLEYRRTGIYRYR